MSFLPPDVQGAVQALLSASRAEERELHAQADPRPADVDGAYYTTAVLGQKTAYLSGPFLTHIDALRALPDDRQWARAQYPMEAANAVFGTVRAPLVFPRFILHRHLEDNERALPDAPESQPGHAPVPQDLPRKVEVPRDFETYARNAEYERLAYLRTQRDHAADALEVAARDARIPVPAGATRLAAALAHPWRRKSAGDLFARDYMRWSKEMAQVESGEWLKSEQRVLRMVHTRLLAGPSSAQPPVDTAAASREEPRGEAPDLGGVNTVQEGPAIHVLFSFLARQGQPSKKIREIGDRVANEMVRHQHSALHHSTYSFMSVWVTAAGKVMFGVGGGGSQHRSAEDILRGVQSDRSLRAKHASIFVFPITEESIQEVRRGAELGAAAAQRAAEKARSTREAEAQRRDAAAADLARQRQSTPVIEGAHVGATVTLKLRGHQPFRGVLEANDGYEALIRSKSDKLMAVDASGPGRSLSAKDWATGERYHVLNVEV